MRVLMLSHAVAPDRIGGLERYVRELSAALVRAGADVTVVAKRIDAELAPHETGPDGVKIVRHGAPAMRRPWYAAAIPFAPVPAVARAIARRPDVIHGHYVLPTVVPAVAGRRYMYTFHAPMWRELLAEREERFKLARAAQLPAQGSVRSLERFVARRAATVVVLSEFMRDELRALDARVAEAAVLLPGGIDISRFSEGDRVDSGDARLFTARRLTPRTGVLELIDAMALVHAQIPHARLAIAGDGALRDAAASRIRELGLADVVALLGRVSDDELVASYRGADLVVLPTQRLEGFGLTTAEALACGTPVLGTPVGATPELLRPLDSDLVASDATPTGIAAATVALLRDPERLRSLRARTRRHVAPQMGWDAIAERYLELYGTGARR